MARQRTHLEVWNDNEKMFRPAFKIYFHGGLYLLERQFLLSNRHLDHLDEACPADHLVGTRERLHRGAVQGAYHALQSKQERNHQCFIS